MVTKGLLLFKTVTNMIKNEIKKYGVEIELLTILEKNKTQKEKNI